MPMSYWLVVKRLAELMSERLPFKFGMPPALVMPGIGQGEGLLGEADAGI